jgi:hypothetical protein
MKKISKLNANSITFKKQAGISNVMLMIYLLVGAIVLLGGMGGLKYIDKSKVGNEVQELTDLKASTISLGNQRGGTYAGITTASLAGLDFWPRNRITGAGAAATVTNQWKGPVTAAAAQLNVPNDSIEYSYSGYPASACKQVVMDAAAIVNQITVGATLVKAANAPVDEAAMTTACDAGGDNGTILYRISR